MVEQIANMMVLPNRYPIQLVEHIDMVELKCPAPAVSSWRGEPHVVSVPAGPPAAARVARIRRQARAEH